VLKAALTASVILSALLGRTVRVDGRAENK